MQAHDSTYILIVEDHAITQEVYRIIFKNIKQNFNTTIWPLFATNGTAALELFKTHDVKLAIINYGLRGGMLGDELAIAMRKIKHVPTIWHSVAGSAAQLAKQAFAWDGELPSDAAISEDIITTMLKDFGIEHETAHTLRVLYVEDELINQRVLTRQLQTLPSWTELTNSPLKNYKIKVTIAPTPKEAVKVFNKNKFDLVFMDYQLKDELNGVDVAKLLKDLNPQPMFIWHSACGNANKVAKEQFNWDAELPKPFRGEDLINILEQYLERTK